MRFKAIAASPNWIWTRIVSMCPVAGGSVARAERGESAVETGAHGRPLRFHTSRPRPSARAVRPRARGEAHTARHGGATYAASGRCEGRYPNF